MPKSLPSHDAYARCARKQRIHSTRRKALPDGDLRGAGICLTLSEYFTSRHGQFFIVCAELLDLFQRHIFTCKYGVVWRCNVLCTLAVWHECGRDSPPAAQPYQHPRVPVEISSHAVWRYVRVCVSDRDVDARLFERGVRMSYEAIRTGWRTFRQSSAHHFRRRSPGPGDTWHVDEVFLMIKRERHALWRAVDRDGPVLDLVVPCRRDMWAA